VAIAADNNVVMHRDPQRSRRCDDLLRHVNVPAGGGGVAGRVIVHQHNRRRRQLQRALYDLAGVNGRVIDGALLLHLIRDELVLLVEEQDPELLTVLIALGRA